MPSRNKMFDKEPQKAKKVEVKEVDKGFVHSLINCCLTAKELAESLYETLGHIKTEILADMLQFIVKQNENNQSI